MARHTHVRNGVAARQRRYESAVRRQIALVDAAFKQGSPKRYIYADPEEFLRRGDELGRFRKGGSR